MLAIAEVHITVSQFKHKQTLALSVYRHSFSIGLTQYFDGILPNSINSALGIDASIAIGYQGRISAYMSPGSNLMSYGAIAEYKFGKSSNSPALVLGWRRDRYDFGRDVFENPVKTNNDTFTILFRVGSPVAGGS